MKKMVRAIRQNIFLLSILLLAGVFSSARGGDATQPTRGWHPDHFVVSFWCSPPEPYITVERYKQIADAGFNLVMPICGPTEVERNKKILRCAQAAGLKVFIEDKRLPLGPLDDKSKAMIDTIIHDYSGFPSLQGYFLADEPQEVSFKILGDVSDYMRAKDPAHQTFINLLPEFPGYLTGKGYDDYISHFISIAHPWMVSYDHYHFTVNGDAGWFFENLESVSRVTRAGDIDFWNIVLATQHLIYRRLTEAEKRFEAMQTLAFGGRGLLWFTYWQPDNTGMWKDAIINFDGTPTYQYEQIKRINHDMAAFGNALLHADWIHTWTSNPPEITVKFDNPQAHWTVGFFKQGWTRMLFIANQDYKNTVASDLHIQTGGAALERFDLLTQKFVPTDTSRLELGPADAALYRWQMKN